MLDIDRAWKLYNDVQLGYLNPVVLISPLEMALRELANAREALREAPCTCRPHAVLHPGGERTKYACLRCRALEV
jgi:hypothetical protein